MSEDKFLEELPVITAPLGTDLLHLVRPTESNDDKSAAWTDLVNDVAALFGQEEIVVDIAHSFVIGNAIQNDKTLALADLDENLAQGIVIATTVNTWTVRWARSVVTWGTHALGVYGVKGYCSTSVAGQITATRPPSIEIVQPVCVVIDANTILWDPTWSNMA